ncbi:Fumarate and nitrate reduction regulatory protein [uncultured bacterium]|nr:Fumarate and nitrate reduction regulatory protein [uncultured bacterium]
MKSEKPITTLQDLPLFSELTIEDLRTITSFSSLKKIEKGTHLFYEGEPYSGFYIVLKGSVKVYRISPQGKEAVMHLVSPFDSFAEVPLFESKKCFPVNAQALESSMVLHIPVDGFLEFLEKHPAVSLKMMAGFAKKLRILTDRLEKLAIKEVSGRLAAYLMSELQSQGKENSIIMAITLSISKATLAAYLGTITETLSRTFQKLAADGIITVKGKKIIIHRLQELQQLAGAL